MDECKALQGGHITRAEPEGMAEWRMQGGVYLAAGGGVVVDGGDGGISAAAFEADEEARLTEAICGLEGRVAMLTFWWPNPNR